MPDRVSGSIELWDGWSLRLPIDCLADRSPDGFWSAWDDLHTIDVHITTVGGHVSGASMDAAALLGQVPTVSGRVWIGYVEESIEADDVGPAHRFAIKTASTNTWMSTWVAYRQPEERAWAERVLAGIEFGPPAPKRRRFGQW